MKPAWAHRVAGASLTMLSLALAVWRSELAHAATRSAPPLQPLPSVRAAPSLPLYFDDLGLNRFARPSMERASSLPATSWLHGRWGLASSTGWPGLDALVLPSVGEKDALWPPDVADEPRMPVLLPALPRRPVSCVARPVTIIRYGADNDRFSLVDCDGAVADGALDRVGVLLRPPEVARPPLPLPDEPIGQRGEWVDGVKMPPPRIVWLLNEIAKAFPWRALYVYSGYRPAPTAGTTRPRPALGGGHGGLHTDARAVDLAVHGVPTTKLFELCRKLPDTGCGYYPNHPFVHVDVRRPGLVGAAWIDRSYPGEPSVYVRSWPGVADADVFTSPLGR
jgi:hypothetical protein